MDYIALSFPGESGENRNARDLVMKTRDFKEGIRQYPFNLRYERTMMHHLIEHPGDFPGAFRALSPKLLRLFVHAYQSYLFNRLLSRRLLAGLALNEAVEGDVVCFLDAHGGPDVTKLEKVTKKNLPDIKFLIKRSRAYVTLPLIGQDTVLDGQAGDEIRRDLEDEGMRIEDFTMAGMPDLASAGLRREILLRVSPSIISANGNAQCKFYLPRGSYATTVLREYMKVAPEHMD